MPVTAFTKAVYVFKAQKKSCRDAKK